MKYLACIIMALTTIANATETNSSKNWTKGWVIVGVISKSNPKNPKSGLAIIRNLEDNKSYSVGTNHLFPNAKGWRVTSISSEGLVLSKNNEMVVMNKWERPKTNLSHKNTGSAETQKRFDQEPMIDRSRILQAQTQIPLSSANNESARPANKRSFKDWEHKQLYFEMLKRHQKHLGNYDEKQFAKLKQFLDDPKQQEDSH